MTEAGRSPGSRALLAASLLPTAVLAIVVAAGLWGFSYDDAFITYRYAERWALGDGLTFNPGEAVLGTTAPGWALVLGLCARVSRAIGLDGLGVPQWGTLLSLLALWWAAAALPALWLPRRSPYQPLVPLLCGTLALTCRWNLELLGGEAFAATALAATAIWAGLALPSHRQPTARPSVPESAALSARSAPRRTASTPTSRLGRVPCILRHLRPLASAAGEKEGLARGRPLAAGLLAGAAMICRIDAAIATVVLALALGWRQRRVPVRFLVVAAATVSPVLLWVWSEVGTLRPNTLAGKLTEAGISGVGYGRAELVWLERSLGGGAAVWVLAALAAAGALLLIRRARRSAAAGPRPALAALAGWLLLHEGFYHLAGVPFAPWYHVALVAALLALAAWAATAAAAAVPVGRPWRRSALAAAPLLVLPLLLPGIEFLAGTWGRPPDVRTRLYAAVAEHLRSETGPGATVASMEIGALGYYSDRPVLDLIGLVDAEVVVARRRGRLAELVAARSPEHILVPPPFLSRELGEVMRHPQIRRRYRPVARFFDPGYEHDPVLLYRRVKPAPAGADARRGPDTGVSRRPGA